MADDKDRHTPESVAAKVVKALLKVKPQPKTVGAKKGIGARRKST